MFQEGLYAYLKSQSSLTALLGTTRGDKTNGIFPMQAPGDATLPYISYARVSGAPIYTLVEGANRFHKSRFRFSVYAASQSDAVHVSEVIKKIFASFVGTFPDADATPVENVMLELEADDAESVPHGTIYACHLDFAFHYIDTA
jgi:hypothetical protein